MNFKAIIQKIVSWFKAEAKSVETVAAVDVTVLNSMLSERISQLEAHSSANGVAIATEQAARNAADAALAAPIDSVVAVPKDTLTTQTAENGRTYIAGINVGIANSTTEADMNNVNVAIQIALALKANDPSLTDAAVQSATNAALAAAYPAPVPTPAA